MGKTLAVIGTVLAGLVLATTVTYAMTSAAAPDDSVDFNNVKAPNNSSSIVDYGAP